MDDRQNILLKNLNNSSIDVKVQSTTDIHTAVWTNNSQEIPSELVEITNKIKKIAHGKKTI